MDVAGGYREQDKVLARRLAAGDRLAGWKMSLTNPRSRSNAHHPEPMRGYLLQSLLLKSGATVQRAPLKTPMVEPELCLRMGQPLRGPGVTAEAARDAVAAAIATFELPDPETENENSVLDDLPGFIAENGKHVGLVVGAELAPLPRSFDPAELVVELRKNGDLAQHARRGDRMDDPFESLAWLANHLALHGHAIETGQLVITGSVTRPFYFAAGEYWEADFLGIGTVSVNVE